MIQDCLNVMFSALHDTNFRQQINIKKVATKTHRHFQNIFRIRGLSLSDKSWSSYKITIPLVLPT